MPPSVLVGLALAVAAPGPKAGPKKDPPSVVGTWVAESVVVGGQAGPIPEGGSTFTLMADGKMIVREGTKAKPEEETYTLDPKKDPPHIDVVPGDGGRMVILRGIYKVDGDTLTLCLGVGREAADRPATFESPAGSMVMLLTLKRAKNE